MAHPTFLIVQELDRLPKHEPAAPTLPTEEAVATDDGEAELQDVETATDLDGDVG